MPDPRRRTFRRLGWGVGDQVLSSLTNFALGVLVARTVDPRGLGTFTALFATYLFALGATRAILLEPHLVRQADRGDPEHRAGLVTAALILGAAVGAVMALVSPLLAHPLDDGLRALAVVMPGLLVQDTVRFVCFADGAARRAAINDGVWVVGMVPALVIVLSRPDPAVAELILAWGAGAGIAACVGLLQTRTLPRPHTLSQVKALRQLGMPLFASFVTMSGWNQVLLYGIAAVAGLSVLGTIRAAEIALGPVNIVSLGLTTVLMPEAARIRDRSLPQLRRLITVLAAGLALVSVAWGAMLLAIPDSLGQQLLGENWAGARSVMVPALLLRAVAEFNQAQKTGLKVLHAGRRLLTLQLWTLPVTVVATLTAAYWYGAYGAIAAKFVALALLTPVWFSALRTASARFSRTAARPGRHHRSAAAGERDEVAEQGAERVSGPTPQGFGEDW